MNQPLRFDEVLDAADHLSFDEQQALVSILTHRLAEAGRRQFEADIQEVRRDFALGRCSPTTPDDLMAAILK